MSEYEIEESVFGGRIPVMIAAASNSFAAPDTVPEPFYALVPRCSYLILFRDRVRQYFHKTEQESDNDPAWFEYNGVPLKWNIPIGVLFDALSAPDQIPWSLTIHFQDLPPSIMPCPSFLTVETYFLNRVKEANYLKHSRISDGPLTKDTERHSLWLGLVKDDFSSFHRINRALMKCPADEATFKKIPFRVYIIKQSAPSHEKLLNWSDEPFEATREGSQLATFQHFIDATFTTPPDKILVHGVTLPPETPVQWICEHFSFPDNFVHLCAFFG